MQGWFIRNFRQEIHRDWLEAAVLAGELSFPDFYTNQRKYRAVRFKPRGWSWIDPTKEVMAYRLAVRAGFMTVSDVIGLTSEHSDAEDVFLGRREELDMMADLDLVFDTDPAQTDMKGVVQAAEPDAPVAEAGTPEAESDQPVSDDDQSANDNQEETADAAA